MKLRELLGALEIDAGAEGEMEITGVAYDAERVVPGELFVAIEEYTRYNRWADGHRDATMAIDRGAAAVIGQREPEASSVSWFTVEHSRQALASLSATFHGRPFHSLAPIGVTGTNGKTTTTHLIAAILRAAGHAPGILGTVGYYFDQRKEDAVYTTPLAPELNQLARRMVDEGIDSLVMEVSSHSLELDRVFAIPFSQAVFTNLTQDHLDFHRDMDEYKRAKQLLFRRLPGDDVIKRAIINLDDPVAGDFIKVSNGAVLTYGTTADADVHPADIEQDLRRTRLKIAFPDRELIVESPLVGQFNVSNVLAAAACAYGRGISSTAIRDGIETFTGVPGRFQLIRSRQGYLVVIDYAHTPDAIKRLLESLEPVPTNRVITVFGAGGDRDRTKRPIMARNAALGSDLCIVTSDNPRTEDPQQIIDDLVAGIPAERMANCQVIADRRAAIRQAIRIAQPDDVVVIAGKGHEDYQILGTTRIHFSDEEEARAAMEARE